MSDPFSIGTGIVGVIGIAIQLTIVVKDFASGWKHAPIAVEELHKELTQLHHVLNNLKGFLNSQSTHFEQTSALYSAASDCVVKLQTFRDKLGKYATGNTFRRTLERIKWPLDEKENQMMLQDLQRYTQLFQFAMGIDAW